jgi:hypothetical protein
VIGLPRGGRAGRASTGHAGCQSDHSAAFNTVLPPARADRNGQDDDAGAPDVGKNHDLADSSVPVTTTNHLTQQPHVKNPLRRRACVTAAGLSEEEQDER